MNMDKWNPSVPLIIGICGPKQSGKTSLANSICKEIGYPMAEQHSLATALKAICYEAFEIDWSPDTDEHKNSLTGVRWEELSTNVSENYPDKSGRMTVREVWQVVGTDLFRNNFPRVWVNELFREIAVDYLETDTKVFVVPDVRFADEALTILDQPGGWLIQLTRGGNTGDTHASEMEFGIIREECRDNPRYCWLDNRGMSVEAQGTWVCRELLPTMVVNSWCPKEEDT